MPPIDPGATTTGEAIGFTVVVNGGWDDTHHTALNDAFAAALGVDVSQITTTASPPPSPFTVHVTVVANNQSHMDWMSRYVACQPYTDCTFTTDLASALALDDDWSSTNTVVLEEDATPVVVAVGPPPPGLPENSPRWPPSPSPPPPAPSPPPSTTSTPSPLPPLSPGHATLGAVDFTLTVTADAENTLLNGAPWSADAQAALNAALAATFGVNDVLQVQPWCAPGATHALPCPPV